MLRVGATLPHACLTADRRRNGRSETSRHKAAGHTKRGPSEREKKADFHRLFSNSLNGRSRRYRYDIVDNQLRLSQEMRIPTADIKKIFFENMVGQVDGTVN
jgi:hypothetical protein